MTISHLRESLEDLKVALGEDSCLVGHLTALLGG